MGTFSRTCGPLPAAEGPVPKNEQVKLGGADESGCTPGSVIGAPRGTAPTGGHPSGPAVAGRFERSTRRLGRAALERLRRAVARSFLTLLRVGFTEPPGSPRALVVSYTTVSPLPPRGVAVSSLWHCPAGRPGLVLPTTL